MFRGELPGYKGCDTVYHDIQHTLDMTLAMARLIASYERDARRTNALGPDRAEVGVVTSRCSTTPATSAQTDDQTSSQRRGVHDDARLAQRALPRRAICRRIGMADWVPVATQDRAFHRLRECSSTRSISTTQRDRRLGQMLGTADLIAQMADRCYLEKCRDRLYPGVRARRHRHAERRRHGRDSRCNTAPASICCARRRTSSRKCARKRLDGEFGGAYRYLEALFNGRNPYMEAIERNLEYLTKFCAVAAGRMLRRDPPCFTWERNPRAEHPLAGHRAPQGSLVASLSPRSRAVRLRSGKPRHMR